MEENAQSDFIKYTNNENAHATSIGELHKSIFQLQDSDALNQELKKRLDNEIESKIEVSLLLKNMKSQLERLSVTENGPNYSLSDPYSVDNNINLQKEARDLSNLFHIFINNYNQLKRSSENLVDENKRLRAQLQKEKETMQKLKIEKDLMSTQISQGESNSIVLKLELQTAQDEAQRYKNLTADLQKRIKEIRKTPSAHFDDVDKLTALPAKLNNKTKKKELILKNREKLKELGDEQMSTSSYWFEMIKNYS
ncbi:hypothetical protein ROZALSC1DRAFT_27152 [Rozella allomycis CSF55]|uniref:Uncharacterized protein n=1 Tax=Rozella allomycis (strain CSF55) TaxID=988480 RepID=A0A075ASZ4_ROZAC|nr:hypothetical protein O9G_003249 [Rozella allomycis CSF55]RKP21436.1 hypothetical protein ROZALSC1DRAFT_27152 [Rozella allomycis CSF55]|eukprot:EPZ33388.1 hypothetical protein O9G_003249 [Rozella allomycis CSF55]